MRNARLHQYPNAPATLLELGALLDQPENQHLTAAIGMQDSVYGGVIGSPGHECILFLSRRMGRYLSKAKEAFADASAKVDFSAIEASSSPGLPNSLPGGSQCKFRT